jgi:ABC-2 type transport system permease protein
MTFWEIFRFEAVYQLRRASTWIYFIALLVLAFLVTTGMLVEEARRGDINANAPIAVANATVFLGMIGLLVTAALAGDAATRDIRSRMQPLLFTAPLGKAAYLGGRFLGAFVVNALLLTALPAGLLLAARMPNPEADLFGPLRLGAYLQPYLMLALPNAFVAAAILFSMARWSRHALASYLGGILLFFSSVLSEEVVAEQMDKGKMGALLDPFAFTALSELWERWTPIEKNTQLLGLDGLLLSNRLLWIAFALGVLALTHLRFRFAHLAEGGRRSNRERPDAANAANIATERSGPVAVPRVARTFDFGTRARQTLAVALSSWRDVVTGRGALVLAGVAATAVFALGTALLDDYLGTPLWPATQFVTAFLGGVFFIEVFIALLTAFYAGELVWREREAGLSEIADATPVPDGVLFAGKLLALGLVLVALLAVLMAAGVLVQALQGYFDFEIGLYLRVLFGLRLADCLLFATLAMLVHVLVNNKYLGHLIALLFALFTVFAGWIGVEHHLLVYGSDPGWLYSDLSGFGPFLAPFVWFKLYWAGWALLFAVVANLFWVRGEERGIRQRVRLARLRFTRPAAAAAVTAAILILAVGGFVFYNTNVLNDYRTGFEKAELSAEYERRYGRYEGVPQPLLTGTKLRVEIDPEAREVEVRGTYRLENRSAQAIGSIHLFVHPDVETRAVEFDRPARVALADDELGHRTYALAEALPPGGSLRMSFEVLFAPRGFPNDDINTSVVGNGTYFDHLGGRQPSHRRWLPVLGYQPSRELSDAGLRREHGLPPRPAARSLDTFEATRDPAGRELIDFEAVIGTAENQIAIAPGTLRRTWTENGRRYFHYGSDAPIRNAYAFFSAGYEVREAWWNDVRIQIFHHPRHVFNLDRMIRSVQASLDYFTEHFGPYPHRHIRIVEFPRYASFAHAYPATISYAEGFGFLSRVDDDQGHLDTPSAVVAHEVSHQWWGHQLVPAGVEGAPMLTEILAQYSAMMVLERIHGREQVRRLLGLMWIEYLNRRNNRENREVPFLFLSDQSNLVYRKGALVMYALREYLGEERVNAALRRFLEKHRSGEPPYPTSRDLYRELQAVTPDSLQGLLADLFEKVTLWDLRAKQARAEPTGTGEWRITLDVVARKVAVDGIGAETEVPMDDWVEIGVFAPAEGEELGQPLHLEKHRLRSGGQSITVTVPRKPTRAGIDPYHLLIERDREDNARELEIN